MSISRLAFFAVALSVAAGTAAIAHQSQPRVHAPQPRGIAVEMDHVTIVTYKDPFSTVFVGNPSVADFTIIDSRHVFVLGKTFGSTNLIALGPDKSVLSNQQITVFGQSAGVVTVNRGPETFNYTCTEMHCETNPIPGNQKAWFDNTVGEIGAHQDAANKAATTTGLQTQH